MKIDWNESPEGYPLWLEDIRQENPIRSCWAREGEGEYEVPGGGFWSYSVEGFQYRVHRRPEAWNGKGLPPVGIEIEALLPGLSNTTFFWQRAKVVHGALPDSPGEVLVFSLETTRPAWADEFRPVRTPEQIAAEERLASAYAMCAIAPSLCNGDAVALYDAGYRKQVAP